MRSTYDSDRSCEENTPDPKPKGMVRRELELLEQRILVDRANDQKIGVAAFMRELALTQAPTVPNGGMVAECPEVYAFALKKGDPSMYVRQAPAMRWLIPKIAEEQDGRQFPFDEVLTKTHGIQGLRYDPLLYLASERTQFNRNHTARLEFAKAAIQHGRPFGFLLPRGGPCFIKMSYGDYINVTLGKRIRSYYTRDIELREMFYMLSLQHDILKPQSGLRATAWAYESENEQDEPINLVASTFAIDRLATATTKFEKVLVKAGDTKLATGQYGDIEKWKGMLADIQDLVREVCVLSRYMTTDDFDVLRMVCFWPLKEFRERAEGQLLLLKHEARELERKGGEEEGLNLIKVKIKGIENAVAKEERDLSNILKGLFD